MARRQWLTPIIRATEEVEIRRVAVLSQAGQTVSKTLSQKKPSQQKGLGDGFKV
jgi:hypothetical protein